MDDDISLNDLKEAMKKSEHKLQTQILKRKAWELRRQEQLGGINRKFNHISDILTSIQLQLLKINKGEDDFRVAKPCSISEKSYTIAEEVDSFIEDTSECKEQKVFDEMFELEMKVLCVAAVVETKIEIRDEVYEEEFEGIPQFKVVNESDVGSKSDLVLCSTDSGKILNSNVEFLMKMFNVDDGLKIVVYNFMIGSVLLSRKWSALVEIKFEKRHCNVGCASFSKLMNVKVLDLMEWMLYLESNCVSLCLRNCASPSYTYDPGINYMFRSGNLVYVQNFVHVYDVYTFKEQAAVVGNLSMIQDNSDKNMGANGYAFKLIFAGKLAIPCSVMSGVLDNVWTMDMHNWNSSTNFLDGEKESNEAVLSFDPGGSTFDLIILAANSEFQRNSNELQETTDVQDDAYGDDTNARVILNLKQTMVSATMDLLKHTQVMVILKPQKFTQVGLVIDIGDKVKVPIISPATDSVFLPKESSPYSIRSPWYASLKAKTIAATVKDFGWGEVFLIKEDTNYGSEVVAATIKDFGWGEVFLIKEDTNYGSKVVPCSKKIQIISWYASYPVRLWKVVVKLANQEDAKLLLQGPTECCTLHLELWLVLVKNVQNKIWEKLFMEHSILINSVESEGANENTGIVGKIIGKGVQILQNEEFELDKEVWMKYVERELEHTTVERRLLDEELQQIASIFKLWVMLGQLEERLGNLERAKKTYVLGFKHFPTCIAFWLSLAHLREKVNGLSKACAILTKSRKKNPPVPELWLAAVRAEPQRVYKKKTNKLTMIAVALFLGMQCISNFVISKSISSVVNKFGETKWSVVCDRHMSLGDKTLSRGEYCHEHEYDKIGVKGKKGIWKNMV